jgi:hypothetical protein
VLATGGEITRGIVVVVQGQPDLFEVILAAHAGSRLADLLHRWQKQSNEDGNDSNDHKQLNQGESPTFHPVCHIASHTAPHEKNGEMVQEYHKL